MKESLQGTLPLEEPIALEELEGECRTSYGYATTTTTDASPALPLPAALVLLLPLLNTLLP